MRGALLTVSVLGLVGALSRTSAAAPGKPCIDDKAATAEMAHLVAQIAAVDHVEGAPRLVDQKCWKRAYVFGKYRLVVSVEYGDGSTSTSVSQSVEMTRPPTCLADAVVAAQRLYPHAKTIIEKAKIAFGERWDDADLGAVIWSTCQPDSSDVLLHELNHKDRDGNCIHVPDAKPLCFTDLSAFPARKIALLKAVETDDADAREAWDGVNREYFVNSGDMGALLLFDEVVAYSITTDVDTAMVAAHFKAIPEANLPFMAMMTAHYLELVRASDPKAFAAHFAVRGTDRSALERMFAIAEQAYAGWKTARAGRPDAKTTGEAEAKMWQRYLDTKRAVLAP